MKSHRSFVPALAGVLVAFGVTAAPAPAPAQLTGQVKSVDTDANKLIMTETGTGTDYAIAVNGQTLVLTTARGRRLEDRGGAGPAGGRRQIGRCRGEEVGPEGDRGQGEGWHQQGHHDDG